MEPYQDLVAANQAYVQSGSHTPHPVRPSRQLAIVTCMDSRIDTFASLGLNLGEAHIIRTAGARVTPDVIRSLALSTHALGTRSGALIGLTDCGLRDPDGTLVERLTAMMGHPPEGRDWHAFRDVDEAVRTDCHVLLRWPDRPDGFRVGGYVLDVASGQLAEVAAPTVASAPPA
jgi:carbonic anhydrase